MLDLVVAGSQREVDVIQQGGSHGLVAALERGNSETENVAHEEMRKHLTEVVFDVLLNKGAGLRYGFAEAVNESFGVHLGRWHATTLAHGWACPRRNDESGEGRNPEGLRPSSR